MGRAGPAGPKELLWAKGAGPLWPRLIPLLKPVGYVVEELGFGVAKPCGDSERYDVILDSRIARKNSLHQIWRVQVKATTQLLNGQYRINAHRRINGRAVPYRPSEVDFLAAHIIPEDAWFLIPIRHTKGRTSLFFSPKKFPRPGPYDAYREAWRFFRKPP